MRPVYLVSFCCACACHGGRIAIPGSSAEQEMSLQATVLTPSSSSLAHLKQAGSDNQVGLTNARKVLATLLRGLDAHLIGWQVTCSGRIPTSRSLGIKWYGLSCPKHALSRSQVHLCSESAGPRRANTEDAILFQGKYRSIHGRDVLLPTGQTRQYELVKGEPAVLVVPFHTKVQQFTLLREFNVGSLRMMHGTVAGMFEEGKHASPLECAQCELEEEAQLVGGKWVPLVSKDTDAADPGDVTLSKYFEQQFWPYLVLDPEGPVADPRPQDEDEFIEVLRGVTLDQVRDLIQRGDIAVIHAYVLLLAIERLRVLGIINNAT